LGGGNGTISPPVARDRHVYADLQVIFYSIHRLADGCFGVYFHLGYAAIEAFDPDDVALDAFDGTAYPTPGGGINSGGAGR
jgi:hypothetical protein